MFRLLSVLLLHISSSITTQTSAKRTEFFTLNGRVKTLLTIHAADLKKYKVFNLGSILMISRQDIRTGKRYLKNLQTIYMGRADE